MDMKEFDKIIGYSSVKKELEQIADTLKNSEIYARLGVTAPKGLLLHGEPGVGKTLMAKCLIKASGCKYYICRKNKPNGDFVKSIKETFKKVSDNAPSIVLLDDMDKFANGDERHRDEEEYVTVQSCIDEVKNKGVFVLATANNIRVLPRSLLRAGRFDRIIRIKAPEGEDAVKIVDHYLQGKPLAKEVDTSSIARILDGRSCAELETVINEAGLYAGFARCEKITMEHIMEACLRTAFGVPAQSFNDCKNVCIDLSDRDSILTHVVYHEAGHAVISEILAPDSVTLVSALNQKDETSGFTLALPLKNVNPLKRDIINILVLLGGMAAVEQKLGMSDSGNESDLMNAFELVEDLVTYKCTCGFSLHSSQGMDSENLHNRQELAAASEIERYYRKAKEIIAQNMEFYEKIASELAENKLLNTADIKRIKSGCKITAVNI